MQAYDDMSTILRFSHSNGAKLTSSGANFDLHGLHRAPEFRQQNIRAPLCCLLEYVIVYLHRLASLTDVDVHVE